MAIQDPIAGKGKAVVLNPVKIPDFSSTLSSAKATNDMQMQLYQIAAQQRQKEAALAAAKAKAEQAAKDEAQKAKNREQADMLNLLKTKEGSFLIGDAPQISRQKAEELTTEFAQLSAKGHTLNDLSPEIGAWRAKVQQYHNWYNMNADVAKSYSALQDEYNKDPFAYETLNMGDRMGVYNVDLAANKQHFVSGLEKKIAPTSEKEIKAMLLSDVKYGSTEKTDLTKGKRFGSNIIYPTSKVSTAAEGSEGYVKSIVDYYQNATNLSKEEIADKKGIQILAGQYGALNDDGTINSDRFAAEVVKRNTPAAIYGEKPADIDKQSAPKTENNNWNFSNGAYQLGSGKNAKRIVFTGVHHIPSQVSWYKTGGQFMPTVGLPEKKFVSAGELEWDNSYSPNDVKNQNILIANSSGKLSPVRNAPKFNGATDGTIHFYGVDKQGNLVSTTPQEDGAFDVNNPEIAYFKGFLTPTGNEQEEDKQDGKLVPKTEERIFFIPAEAVYPNSVWDITKKQAAPLQGQKIQEGQPNIETPQVPKKETKTNKKQETATPAGMEIDFKGF